MLSEPADTPVTIPELFTVAMAVCAELQVPPDVASVRVVVAVLQSDVAPDMAATTGIALTVI